MAQGNLFTIEIVTPDRVFYTGEADFVEFTSVNGEVGVYREHEPTTMVLAPGAVTIHKGEKARVAAVHSGFVEILPERVTFLAELAEWPDEIDVSRAQAALDRAKDRLESHTAETDMKRAEFALRKALTRLDVAQQA